MANNLILPLRGEVAIADYFFLKTRGILKVGESKRRQKLDSSFGIKPGKFNATKMKNVTTSLSELFVKFIENKMFFGMFDKTVWLYESQYLQDKVRKDLHCLDEDEFQDLLKGKMTIFAGKHGRFECIAFEDYFFAQLNDIIFCWKTRAAFDFVLEEALKISWLVLIDYVRMNE